MYKLKEKNPNCLKRIFKIIKIHSLTKTFKLKKFNQLSWFNVLRAVEESSIVKLWKNMSKFVRKDKRKGKYSK